MEQLRKQATEYLDSVLGPLIPGGFEILSDDNVERGVAFSVVPKVYTDYKFLLGWRGKNIGIVRSVMRLWNEQHAKGFTISVFVPNRKYIQDE